MNSQEAQLVPRVNAVSQNREQGCSSPKVPAPRASKSLALEVHVEIRSDLSGLHEIGQVFPVTA